MSIDLDDAWRRLVASGAVTNLFRAASGETIEVGVRIGPGGPESYALESSTGTSVCEPMARTVLGSGIEVLFNPVGGFKPYTPPPAPGRQAAVPSEVERCSLRCQEPDNPLSLLQREPLVQVSCPNQQWRAYPNIAPWEPRGILIWVPCRMEPAQVTLPHLPQVLDLAYVEDFLSIATAGENMVTFFNALHGGASANHLHFQSVYSDHAMTVESVGQVSIGTYTALTQYPAGGLVFGRNVSAAALWAVVGKIQKAGFPYNLIALSTGIYLFVRNPDFEVVDEFPGRAFGAINFAGLFITSNMEELSKITDERVAAAYGKMTLDAESILQLLQSS